MKESTKKAKEEVQKLIEMSLEDFCKFVEDEIVKTPKVQNGISLEFPCDLRASIEEKMYRCSAYHKWTAFMNNAGTLCHVISADAEILVRIKFGYPVKHLSTNRMLENIKARIQNWILI